MLWGDFLVVAAAEPPAKTLRRSADLHVFQLRRERVVSAINVRRLALVRGCRALLLLAGFMLSCVLPRCAALLVEF